MDPKITKFTHESIYVLCCLYKKFWSQTSIGSSLWLQILSNPSQRYDSSSEILWFVNIVHDRLCETYSIFTIATMYDIMRSKQISWFSDFACFFLNSKTIWPRVSGRVSRTRCLKFLFIYFLGKTTHWT